ERGDGDPLDVCVLSERPISRAEVLLRARVVGGIPMRDAGEADDKIVSVLEGDPVYGGMRDLAELPPPLVSRLVHYFATYKLGPDLESGGPRGVTLGTPYGHAHAERVVRAAMDDYLEAYGAPLSPDGRLP